MQISHHRNCARSSVRQVPPRLPQRGTGFAAGAVPSGLPGYGRSDPREHRRHSALARGSRRSCRGRGSGLSGLPPPLPCGARFMSTILASARRSRSVARGCRPLHDLPREAWSSRTGFLGENRQSAGTRCQEGLLRVGVIYAVSRPFSPITTMVDAARPLQRSRKAGFPRCGAAHRCRRCGRHDGLAGFAAELDPTFSAWPTSCRSAAARYALGGVPRTGALGNLPPSPQASSCSRTSSARRRGWRARARCTVRPGSPFTRAHRRRRPACKGALLFHGCVRARSTRRFRSSTA